MASLRKSELNGTGAPKMMKDYGCTNSRFKTRTEGGEYLYPKIDPVKPRASGFRYGGSQRFGKTALEPGKDSPGPSYYWILGPFDKQQRKSGKWSTFGSSERITPDKREDDRSPNVANIEHAFNMTKKRAPSAVLLGRYNSNLECTPGPGHYDVPRDPAPGGKTLVIRPPSAPPRRVVMPEPGPGDYEVPRTFLKKTHSKATFGIAHNYEHCHINCCKFCCTLTSGKQRRMTSTR